MDRYFEIAEEAEQMWVEPNVSRSQVEKMIRNMRYVKSICVSNCKGVPDVEIDVYKDAEKTLYLVMNNVAGIVAYATTDEKEAKNVAKQLARRYKKLERII